MKVLATTPYNKVYTYSHPQDSSINWSFMGAHDENASMKPEYVVMAPVIEDEQGEQQLILQTHIRPPRINTKNKGVTVEVPAGSASDEDAKGSLDDNAKREILEETNMKVKKLHDVCCVPAGVATHSAEGKFYVAECEIDKEIKPHNKPDITQLATFSVPLKQAMAYLMDLTKKGVDVSNEAFLGAMFAIRHFKVPMDFSAAIPKPRMHWSVVDANPNAMQKDGLEVLKANKDFLPEAAVSKVKPSGFFAGVWNWFTGLFKSKS